VPEPRQRQLPPGIPPARDWARWQEFEDALLAAEKPDYFKNLQYFEALYHEAVALGVLPPTDPLEGIEVDIRLADIVARPHVS
jgi:hypothetical protein